MQYSARCIDCMIDKQYNRIKDFKDESIKSEYMRGVCRIIAESGDNASAPMITADVNELFKHLFGDRHEYEQEKLDFNRLMMSLEQDIQNNIDKNADPLYSAILYAMAGNYIDFGAAGNVKKDILMQLLESSQKNQLDMNEYRRFCNNLKNCKRLVYLTDNCGEIVMDKLLIKTIIKLYPYIKIDAIVRGGDIINDATMFDAELIGLTDIVDVTPNGTAIPGTQLDRINEESKLLIEQADVIISKGQGNFESLYGTGMNTYYMFLCKCDWFVHRFRMAKNSGIFAHEKNIVTYD